MNGLLISELCDRIASQAKHTSVRTSKPVEQVVVDWLESFVTDLPVDELSDEELLALSTLQLSQAEQTKLGQLLSKNREGRLTPPEKRVLDGLMRTYEYGLRRKAQALRMTVQRGLIEPLG